MKAVTKTELNKNLLTKSKDLKESTNQEAMCCTKSSSIATGCHD